MQGKKKKIDVHQWGTQSSQYLQIFGEKKKIREWIEGSTNYGFFNY